MIVEHLKTKRKKTSVVHYGGNWTPSRNLTQMEYLRRNALIKKLADEAGYKFGDLLRPVDDKKFKQEGFYRCTGICTEWYQFKGQAKDDLDVEWPQKDNPMIVQALNLHSNLTTEGTTNYFRKATDDEKQTYENSPSC